jgi:O-antigen/teichoic acid export membrane protein
LQVLRNIITLAGGTITAQAVYLLSMPILTRQYTPEAFGIYTLFTAVNGLGLIFATGRYEYAILNGKDPGESREALWLVGTTAFVGSGTIFFGLLFLRWHANMLPVPMALVSKIANIPGTVLILCSLSIFFTAIYTGLYYWSNLNQQYRSMALSRVSGALANGCIAISLGFWGAKSYGLIFGLMAGQVCNVLFLIHVAVKTDAVTPRPSMITILATGKNNINYPKYLIPSGLLERIGADAHFYFLTALFGTVSVGYLGLCQRAVALPSQLVGSAIGDVFKRTASESLRNNGECTSAFWQTLLISALIGFFPAILLFCWGPFLFSSFFGEQWRIAGEYARILSIPFYIGFIVSPVSSLFFLADKQRYDFWLQIFRLPLIIAGIFSGYVITHSVTGVLIGLSVVLCLKYALEFFLSFRIAYGHTH